MICSQAQRCATNEIKKTLKLFNHTLENQNCLHFQSLYDGLRSPSFSIFESPKMVDSADVVKSGGRDQILETEYIQCRRRDTKCLELDRIQFFVGLIIDLLVLISECPVPSTQNK